MTDERAAFAFGTVKKRIRMCGRPAVPSTSPMPSDTVSSGSVKRRPGWRYAAPSGDSERASRNRSSGFHPSSPSTQTVITVAAAISRTALMIWTQLVASMPPATM